MKKLTFLSVLTLLLCMAATKAHAYDFEAVNADGVTIWYNLINNGTEAEVTYNTYGSYGSASYFDEVINIPSTVAYNDKTLSVTSIGERAFYDCWDFTSVNIPNRVTSIGERAFSGCRRLTSVNIPNCVTSIGEDAFFGCSGLTSVNIPNSVISIGDAAFADCAGLSSIVVDANNQTYDSRDNCNAIIETASNTLIAGCKNTIIPNDVTSVGSYVFLGCSDLISVDIPESVTSIGERAFYYCTGLTSVTIPNSVTSIGYDAFSYCI